MHSMRAIDHQHGAALLITIIVMLVLTLIAMTAARNNALQIGLIRANQSQLTVFNRSMAHIDVQLEALEQAPFEHLGDLMARNDPSLNVTLPLLLPDLESQFIESATLQLMSLCSDVESGARCARLSLEVSTQLVDSSLRSDQRQIFDALLPDETDLAKEKPHKEEQQIVIEKVAWVALEPER